MNTGFKNLLRLCADFFAPRECMACGKTNPKGEFGYLCPSCAAKIYFIRGGACLRCGEIVASNNAPFVQSCSSCALEKPFFNRAASACLYGDKGAERLLFALKYGGGTFAAADLARMVLKNNNAANFLKGALLCPVPLHKSRLRKRNYNQSELIARKVAELAPFLNIRIANLLERRRNTRTQTSLDKAQRAANVRGAFSLSAGARDILKTERNNIPRVVIFDDVMTTSATASECAKVLKRAGFEAVDCFCVFKRL